MSAPAQLPSSVSSHPALTATDFFRLSVADYDDMIEKGILTTDDRVELLDGYLVAKMPQNNPHSYIIDLLLDLLVRITPQGWRKRIQTPIRLSQSEPEPDGVIARGGPPKASRRHPDGDEVGLVIEVADTSLRIDRSVKGPLYAQASIPTYWIVNFPESQIEVYTHPSGPAESPSYAHRQDYRIGDSISLVLDGQTVAHIPVAELLP